MPDPSVASRSVRRAYVKLTLLFHQEDKQWVGVCHELGVSSWGDSFEEAKDALEDLVVLDLNALEDIGERERFFQEHGIKVYYDGDDDTIRFLVHPGVYATALKHDLNC